MTTPIRKAVFPVGGLGTRFLPATKALPKEMLPVVDKPLIQYAFEEAREAGIEEFIFITGRNKSAISNHFDHVYELQHVLDSQEKAELLAKARDWLPKAGHIAFIRQQSALGLGHAVHCARNFIGNEPFAVLLADELFMAEPSLLKQMVKAHTKQGGNMVAVQEIDPARTGSYGIAAVKDASVKGRVLDITDMVEKPKPADAPSNLALVGRYILQPEIFNYLEQCPKGAGGEIQLTDAMRLMLKAGKQPYSAFNTDAKRFDCGSRIGFLEANIAFALADEELHDRMQAMLKRYSA